MKDILKIAFFGQSGSGKTEAGNFAMQVGADIGLNAIRLDVATPLHAIQAFAYTQFGLANTGQDQELLRFLATKFEPQLPISFNIRLNKILSTTPKPVLIINADVRNNSYECLKSFGFIFVKILSAHRDRIGDITSADLTARVEQSDKITSDCLVENYSDLTTLNRNIKNLILTLS